MQARARCCYKSRHSLASKPKPVSLKCALNVTAVHWWRSVSVHMHLSTYMSRRLSHSRAGQSTSDLTLSGVFITSSWFWCISPNCTFLEKSYCCDFLLLLWSIRSSTIAFPLALGSFHFPPPCCTCSLPSLPQEAQLLSSSLLVPSVSSRSARHKPLTRSARRPPSSSTIHLLPAVFHAVEDSCLNVYVKSYFLFLLSPDQLPEWTLWHVLKYSRWWAK